MTAPYAPRTAYVAFGSNLGPRRRTIERALRALGRSPGVRLTAVSSLYETAPVGGPAGQGAFLNGVAAFSTSLTPMALLGRLHDVERRFGRRRGVRWGPRTLDLDLLAVDGLLARGRRLTLPHPRYHERAFVLAPFCDLAPAFLHPRLRRRNRTLLRGLTSRAGVTMIGRWKKSRFQPSKPRRKIARPSSR